jgi:2'-5' RNA ligase
VAPHQYHFTLKFLGETPGERLEAAREAAGRAALGVPPFDLSLEGLGAFPEAGPPRVVWAGCGVGREALAALARAVEQAFGEAGFPPEPRIFAPHLTVGRVKDPRSVPGRAFREALAREGATVLGSAPARELVLFRSDLSPAGPSYVPLAVLPLGGRPAMVTPGS